MAGFLAFEWIRTHEASLDVCRDTGLARPIATWAVGVHGRPICRWREEDSPHATGATAHPMLCASV